MTAAAQWPVRVAGLGPVQVGTVLWTLHGQHNVTVLVKGTYRFVPDGTMVAVDAEPIRLQDEHAGVGGVGSVQSARETAPLLQRAEVVLTGHALAPSLGSGPRRATESDVRLELVREGTPLIDKTLLIYGDRQAGGDPLEFERMPVSYERALGGIGCADNPLGKGLGASAQSRPNVVDPAAPNEHVGCFGAIPASFPGRRQLLRGEKKEKLEGLRLDISGDFDWAYFQCAPSDQRVDSLRGDEWLQLEGLTEELRLCTRLPGAKGVARILGAAEVGVPGSVPLIADLLQIDADRGRCSLMWRGSFPVADEAAADRLVVVGASEEAGHAVPWPRSVRDLSEASFQQPSPSGGTVGAVGGNAGDLYGTMQLDVEPPTGPATPFDGKRATPRPAAGRAAQTPHATVPGHAGAAATPFEKPSSEASANGANGAEPPRQDMAFDQPLQAAAGTGLPALPGQDETEILTESALTTAGAKAGSPFALATPGHQRAAEEPPSEPPPGAPWAKRAAPSVPKTDDRLLETVAVGAAMGDGPARPPLAKPPLVEPPIEAEVVPPVAGAKGAHRESAVSTAAKAEAKRQADEEAAAAAKRQADEEAEAKLRAEAEAEAEARRRAAAEKFAAEQQRAKAAEAEREAAQLNEKRKASKTLSNKMFGGFRRKK